MFVINIKLDFKKILIACLVVALLIVTVIEFGSTTRLTSVNSNTDNKYDYILTEENFISSLKTIHENIEQNLGKTIKISGFVFRMPDFKDEFFVCGRNTIVNSEEIVAGFLCNSKDASKLVDNEWIEITGVVAKGDYNGTMPIIQVGNVKKITAPANSYVESTP